VYFFVRVTRAQLVALHASTDCIGEVELAPQPLRDLKLLEDLPTRDLADFALTDYPSSKRSELLELATGLHGALRRREILARSCAPIALS